MQPSTSDQQLWIELPPIETDSPKRLLIFLHGAQSNPDLFAPVAIAWQLKFPSAAAFILQAPIAVTASSDGDGNLSASRFNWFLTDTDPLEKAKRFQRALDHVAGIIEQIQKAVGLSADQTVVVGFGDGGSLAIGLGQRFPKLADRIVSYAGQLMLGTDVTGKKCSAITAVSSRSIHLVHGELDSVVTPDKAHWAYRQLQHCTSEVTLDVIVDGTHGIDQDFIISGTTRVMQALFKGRTPKPSLRSNLPRSDLH